MIQKIFLVILFSLGSIIAFAQPFDCSKFKEGKFRTADHNVGSIIITERRGGFQTESNEALKLVIRFRINWTDNCSYTLTLDKIIRNENKIAIPSNTEVKVKIVETSRSSYIQESSSSITNGTTRSEVTKLD
jgi:hypothetical protein